MTVAGDAPLGSVLVAESLSKRYGRRVALHDVSFDIAQGELVGIIGPSGCGKSTTLRLLSGLERPSSGRLLVGGNEPHTLPPALRTSKLVFQSYALFPQMSVYENVAFGLKVRRTPTAEIKRKVSETLELVGLSGREESRPRELSGGEQQRVAISRALITEPQLLLLDEPFAALDAKITRVLELQIKELQERLGITVVIVTHDQQQVLSIANHLVVMRDGRVEQAGTSEEVYRWPRTRFIAEFLGEVNFIRATVRGVEDGVCHADMLGATVTATLAPGATAHPGDEVDIAVRPEDVLVGPADGDGHVRFRCTRVAFHGAHRRIALDQGGSGATVFAHVMGGDPVAPGDAVGVTWRPGTAVAVTA